MVKLIQPERPSISYNARTVISLTEPISLGRKEKTGIFILRLATKLFYELFDFLRSGMCSKRGRMEAKFNAREETMTCDGGFV